MDTCFAIEGKDFSILAYERTYNNQIFRLSANTDKHVILDSSKVLCISGKKCDADVFGNIVKANLQFQKFKEGQEMSVHEAAFFIKNKLSEALRKGPFEINCLLMGFDKKGPAVYYFDYTGVCQKVKFGVQGYAQYLLMALINDERKEDMNENEVLEIVRKCIHAMNQRFMVKQENWTIMSVNNSGVRTINN